MMDKMDEIDDLTLAVMCDQCDYKLNSSTDAALEAVVELPPDYFVEFFRFVFNALREILYAPGGGRRNWLSLVLMLPKIVMVLREIIRLIARGIQDGRAAQINPLRSIKVIDRISS